MRWIAIISAATLGLTLPGCSATRIGYNNAPALLYYWLDGYFDFDARQSASVRESLQALQDWHRKEEVPLVAEVLTNLQASATQNVTSEEVCRLYGYLLARAQAPVDRFAPALTRVAASLSTAQLAHIAKQYEKRNQDWREEWLDASPAERTERRVKQIVERAESFYGRLSDAQRAQIKLALDGAGYDPMVQYTETLRRQQDSLQTLTLLRTGTLSEAKALAEMQSLIARSVTSPDPAYRRYAEQTRQRGCAAVAELHNGSTSAQRAKMLQALKGYEADARSVMESR